MGVELLELKKFEEDFNNFFENMNNLSDDQLIEAVKTLLRRESKFHFFQSFHQDEKLEEYSEIDDAISRSFTDEATFNRESLIQLLNQYKGYVELSISRVKRYYEVLDTGPKSVNKIIPEINMKGLEYKNGYSVAENINYNASAHSSDMVFANECYHSSLFGKKISKEKPFNNQIVVDLGFGGNPLGYFIADMGGAKAYIGVDSYHYYLLDNDPAFLPNHILREIPFALVGEDILNFLSRLPDNSVSIFCSGIDKTILNSRSEYVKKIDSEIYRVLSMKGSCIIAPGAILYPNGDKLNINRESVELNNGNYSAIYKK